MTLEDKLQQIQLLSDGQVKDEDARNGVGSVFSLVDPVRVRELQEIAVNESRLGIPILFAYDTIHGFRTIFPVPLGAASSFDPEVGFADSRFGARESTAVGLKQIYSPMVDVSHEPRWGRIAEAGGEDPYLNSVFAAARVKGAQGSDYGDRDRVVTSVKHYAAYGQPEGGRDYNTTDMSVARLHNLYLPPFKAAIDAGSDTVMCSFNAINGVPGCANHELETDLLKREWGFDGFIESDYTAVAEMRGCPALRSIRTGPMRPRRRGRRCRRRCPRAQRRHRLRDGEHASSATTARSCSTRAASRCGASTTPYGGSCASSSAPGCSTARTPRPGRRRGGAAPTRRGRGGAPAAGRSMVLLKNEGGILPLDPGKKTAVIGPLADSEHDMLGPWWGRGRDEDAVTVFDGIAAQSPGATFAQGCTLSNLEPPAYNPAQDCNTDAGFAAAVAAAQAADQVVLALGETREMSGEAASRSEIGLPGRQQELIDAIRATGKPFVVVLFNGRPLTLGGVGRLLTGDPRGLVPGRPGRPRGGRRAVRRGQPGREAPRHVPAPRRPGADLLQPRADRPAVQRDAKYNSRYRDIASCDPLYGFGFGLSYSTFEISNLRLSAPTVSARGRITATVDVAHTDGPAGDEVVQLYINDPVASLTQPVRRLRGFERVTLEPGQRRTVSFTLDRSDFGFYDNRGRLVVEPGAIDVYAGNSAAAAELTVVLRPVNTAAGAPRGIPVRRAPRSRAGRGMSPGVSRAGEEEPDVTREWNETLVRPQ